MSSLSVIHSLTPCPSATRDLFYADKGPKRVCGSGACRDIPFKVKDKLLHLASPTTKKEAQCLVGLFGFWRQHIPHLGVLLRPIYQVTQKAASFVWDLKQEKALQQVQAAMQAALSLGPYDPADPMVLEVLVADSDAV